MVTGGKLIKITARNYFYRKKFVYHVIIYDYCTHSE